MVRCVYFFKFTSPDSFVVRHENMIGRKRKAQTERLWIRNGKRLIRLDDIEEAQTENYFSNFSTENISQLKSKSDNRGLSILDLPDECILAILKKLNGEPLQMGKIIAVCKRFYNISFDPRLWRVADFRISSSNIYEGWECIDVAEHHLSEYERRKMYARFLMQRRAKLSRLRIYCQIYIEMDTFRALIKNCCTKDLQFVEIKWTLAFWRVLLEERRNATLICFQEILEKLSVRCPNICFLKSQIDGSCKTARILGTMTNIQHIDLRFIDFNLERESNPSPIGPIEIILSSLPKLKILKVELKQCVYPRGDFGGLSLKSDSLEHLEYTHTKGFLIKEIAIPKLHTFMAIDTFEYYQGIICPCLFDLIEEGCPNLTTLNTVTSATSGLRNFFLDEDVKREMNICQCSVHAPWRRVPH